MASFKEAFLFHSEILCRFILQNFYAAIFNYKYSFLQALCLHGHLDEWDLGKDPFYTLK